MARVQKLQIRHEAIVTHGSEKREIRKVCANTECPIHHPKKQQTKADTSYKAEQEKRRREEALANATGLSVLNAVVAAVPVRLMKRDLLFIAESLLPLLDEKRLSTIARNRGIRPKEGEAIGKVLTAWLRKSQEGAVGRFLVETTILLPARSGVDAGKVLRSAADVYKFDTDTVVLRVKQEFAAKVKAGKSAKPDGNATAKPKRVA